MKLTKDFLCCSRMKHWFCPLCRVVIKNEVAEIQEHILSRKHVELEEKEDTWVCVDCLIVMQNTSKKQHLNGKRHRSAVARKANENVTACKINRNAGKVDYSLDQNTPNDTNDQFQSTNYMFIEDLDNLMKIVDFVLSPSLNDKTLHLCAVDCEGLPKLDVVQITTPTAAYVIDCVSIGPKIVCEQLKPILENSNILKLFHDLHQDVLALYRYDALPRLVLDTQLASEFLTGNPLIAFNEMLELFESPGHPLKNIVKSKFFEKDPSCWEKRPLPNSLVSYAALDVSLLRDAFVNIKSKLGESNIQKIIKASELRVAYSIENDGKRSVCFDLANNYAMASSALLGTFRPRDMVKTEALKLESEVRELIDLLSDDLSSKLLDQENKCSFEVIYSLSDVVLDVGRRPWCWINQRVMLSDDENRLVTREEIDDIVSKLEYFGSDNRAGLPHKLHRISCMRDREGTIMGLTMRVGRWFRGNAAMLTDLLIGAKKNILILGEPGSGKTTIVREAVRVLADENNVCVVDTSNEIGGDGMIPHECIGFARRMMVNSLDDQSRIMVECVQNHTPHVMVIDEIGRSREVDAARTVKQRGVRIIASAHGNLRSLIKNKELRGLIGGIESVTVGDDAARADAARRSRMNGGGGDRTIGMSKTLTKRMSEPTFEVIVEVQRGKHHEWSIVKDVARAVDDILDGQQYKTEIRSRDPQKNDFNIRLSRS